jgi:16S rRNA (cytosine1402-N4)-methyltransferase
MTAAHPRHQSLHTPVLLRDVVSALAPIDGGLYLDATFGNGGYTEAILEAAACTVIAIDRDPDAIARGGELVTRYGNRLRLYEGCFSDMRDLAGPDARLDGIAFDLGVCSTQIDQAERGFSFRLDGPLDMRMSKSGDSAADIVMRLDERALAQILWDYGEERASRRIARAIVRARTETPITTTGQLAAIIHAVMPAPRPGQVDPATRSFQALRIHINRELDEIEDGLGAAEAMLKPGGILAVVSFHSLEDRIVKRFLGARSSARPNPSRHIPAVEGPAPTFELISRKPILPNAAETATNARARSAKLRVARRTDAPADGGSDTSRKDAAGGDATCG